jgi:hypothetical protein
MKATYTKETADYQQARIDIEILLLQFNKI